MRPRPRRPRADRWAPTVVEARGPGASAQSAGVGASERGQRRARAWDRISRREPALGAANPPQSRDGPIREFPAPRVRWIWRRIDLRTQKTDSPRATCRRGVVGRRVQSRTTRASTARTIPSAATDGAIRPFRKVRASVRADIGAEARLAEQNLLGLLRIDVFADTADLVVLKFEYETIFIFVILAVGYFSPVREFDDHRVAVAISFANFAVQSLRKKLTHPGHEFEDLILAALQSRNPGRSAENQPAHIV